MADQIQRVHQLTHSEEAPGEKSLKRKEPEKKRDKRPKFPPVWPESPEVGGGNMSATPDDIPVGAGLFDRSPLQRGSEVLPKEWEHLFPEMDAFSDGSQVRPEEGTTGEESGGEALYQEQKEKSCKEEQKSCKMKEMGISLQLIFQLLPDLHNELLKLGPRKNSDNDRIRAIEDNTKMMHALTIKINDKSRKRREEPVERGKKTGPVDRFKFHVPPQLLTELGEQRTGYVWKKKPVPEEPLCGWTRHITKGEAVWDPKGCDLTLTKYVEHWEFIMNKITLAEGGEFEIEIARIGLSEGNSYEYVKLGPMPAPEQKLLVTTKVMTTMVAAAVTTNYH